MAVKIRLKRMGKIRTPFYRVVVVDSRKKRDGRVIEEIGTYNPKTDPSTIHVESERVQYWLGVGAQPSEPVAAILKVTGDWQQFKGEPAPEPMQTPESKRDKTDAFNEALKDVEKESKSTSKKSSKSKKDTAKKKAAAKADEPAAEEAPAEDHSHTERAQAEPGVVEGAVEEEPADEVKTEEESSESSES